MIIFRVLVVAALVAPAASKKKASKKKKDRGRARQEQETPQAPCVAFCFLANGGDFENIPSLLPARPRIWYDFFQEGIRKGLAHVLLIHTAQPVELILSRGSSIRARNRVGADVYDFFKERCSHETLKTGWGGIGLVRATLVLWRDAIAQDPSVTHLALLSDSHVPLSGFENVWREIARLNRTAFGDFPPDYHGAWTGMGYPRAIAPENRRKHHQWFVAARADADWFLAHDFTDGFIGVVVPDERYFMSLMTQYDRPYELRNTTFVEWRGQVEGGLPEPGEWADYVKFTRKWSPATFTRVDAALAGALWNQGHIFMRKVDHATVFAKGWNGVARSNV